MLEKSFSNLRLITLVFFALFIDVSTQQVFAQTNSGQSSQSSSSSLNLDISPELGGTYFQDPSSLQQTLLNQSYETVIDQSEYELGPNDIITIEVNSTRKIIFKSILVNSNGDITLPSIGIISLNGLSIINAEVELGKKLNEIYKEPKVNVSIDVPRKVNVHVSGSIPYPGKFLVPAQSRVDLAIYQSIVETKGISQESSIIAPIYTSTLLSYSGFSYRNIEIVHVDGSTSKADLVKYFKTGDLSSNPMIQDGDIIVIKNINPRSPTISISGSVNRSYNLEYKADDTVHDLITIAGGVSEKADTSKVIITRIEGNKTTRIELAKADWKDFEIEPFDRIVVPKLQEIDKSGVAWIEGEVLHPGAYPIIPNNTSVNQLIELAGGLSSNSLPSASYLIRSGEIENEIPNKFNANLMSRTSDQYIQGLEYLNQETNLSRNQVFIDLTNPEELENIILANGDRLYIPKDERTVFVFGQVNQPGYFPYTPSNNAFDYIDRAGGYALTADKDRVYIIKAGNSAWYRPNDTDLESGDRVFVDKYPTEDLNALRSYEVQKQQIKNTRIQLIMTGLTTITSVITAYVAITR